MRPRDYPVRFSRLKRMAQSPAHYLASLAEDQGDTLSMRLGRGVHALLTGTPQVVVYPGKVRRGAAWDQFREEHCNDEILTQPELEQADMLCAAVARNVEAERLMQGEFERTIAWKLQGRQCQGTPDVIGGSYIVDVKTTRCSDPYRFTYDALRRQYHAQLAWYRQGVSLSGLGTRRDAYIIAIESVAPHPVTVMRLTERALEKGERLCRLWFERLLGCEENDHWPGYCEAVVDLDVSDDAELVFGDDVEAA